MIAANDNKRFFYGRREPVTLLWVFVIVIVNFSAMFFAVYLFAKLLSPAEK